jgi:hypothetical protein
VKDLFKSVEREIKLNGPIVLWEGNRDFPGKREIVINGHHYTGASIRGLSFKGRGLLKALEHLAGHLTPKVK